MKKSKIINSIFILIICALTLLGCNGEAAESAAKSLTSENNIEESTNINNSTDSSSAGSFSLDNIPQFSNEAYVSVNNNEPFFKDSDYTTESFETYSELDSLGRCGIAYANVGKDLMPTEERGNIGMIKPSGWQTVKYDNVDGKYLYNRCHLIGYQLTAENANEKNLITGTRYLNIEGMLPFENMVADYIKETGNHVLYRVTPVYEGNNLVATGVLMEGKSVEDKGSGICFNVFAYNSQPGININYATGESSLGDKTSTASPSESETSSSENTSSTNTNTLTYILNTNSHKFHKPDCSSASKISDANRKDFYGTREELIEDGYEPCKICNP